MLYNFPFVVASGLYLKHLVAASVEFIDEQTTAILALGDIPDVLSVAQRTNLVFFNKTGIWIDVGILHERLYYKSNSFLIYE